METKYKNEIRSRIKMWIEKYFGTRGLRWFILILNLLIFSIVYVYSLKTWGQITAFQYLIQTVVAFFVFEFVLYFGLIYAWKYHSIPEEIYDEQNNTIAELQPILKKLVVSPFNDPSQSIKEKIGIVLYNPNENPVLNINIELREIRRSITNGEWNTITQTIIEQPADDNCHFKRWANTRDPMIGGDSKEVIYLGQLNNDELLILLEKKNKPYSHDNFWVAKMSNDVAISYFELDFFIKWTIDEKRFSEHCGARIEYVGTRIYSNPLKKTDETIVTQIFMRDVVIYENKLE